MKFLNFDFDFLAARIGLLLDDRVIDLVRAASQLPDARPKSPVEYPFPETCEEALMTNEYNRMWVRNVCDALRYEESMSIRESLGLPFSDINLFAPNRYPHSLRDFYAFEQHVKTANENRGRSVPQEWYQFPIFYFTNTNTIYGSGATIPYPSYSDELDFELEIACVIGKDGINIRSENAEKFVLGFTIMNDWSARDVQRLEMKVGLGPAKGKDFATSLGPCIVTPDEFTDRHAERPGVSDIEMVARVNGVERSRGNMKDLYWSFGQMIERASQDVWLQPGDVIGSGTVGTGCLLELTKGEGPWLQPGDVVELEIERIGILRNTIGEKKQAISP